MAQQPETTESSSSVHNFFDRNVRYLKYPFFGLGLVGVVVIARSIRLGTKFMTVKSIPEEFFKKHFTLQGKVAEVKKLGQNEQALILLIDHAPILPVPKRLRPLFFLKPERPAEDKDKLIQVRVPGLEIKSQFLFDVQSKLSGQNVSFTLITKDEAINTAYALVYLRKMKFKIFPTYENLGFWCAKNGFGAACIPPYPSDFINSQKFNAYYSKLLKLEEKAVRKHRGMWKRDAAEVNRENWLSRVRSYFHFWKK